jgi:hypothetical protein
MSNRAFWISVVAALAFWLGVAASQHAQADHTIGSTLYCSNEDDALVLMGLLMNSEGAEAERLVHTDSTFKCYAASAAGPFVDAQIYGEFVIPDFGPACILTAQYGGSVADAEGTYFLFASKADCLEVTHQAEH